MKKETTTLKKNGSKEGNGGDSPSQLIDARIEESGGSRGETLAGMPYNRRMLTVSSAKPSRS